GLLLAADIARVDAQAVHPVLGDLEGDLVVEMNVGHQRYLHLAPDLAEGVGRLHAGHGDTHDVGTDVLKTLDLGHGGRHVAGLGVGHALHADRGVSAHGNIAHHDLTGLA